MHDDDPFTGSVPGAAARTTTERLLAALELLEQTDARQPELTRGLALVAAARGDGLADALPLVAQHVRVERAAGGRVAGSGLRRARDGLRWTRRDQRHVVEQHLDRDRVARVAQQQGALEQYLREAEQKIARAREALEAELASESRIFEEALEKIRTETQERVRRVLEGAPPRMRLLLRPIANGRTILHVERVSPDDAVLLLYALTGRIPSRYGYLFDDSTNDVTQAPEPLYPDEGVTDDKVRCDPPALRNFLGSAGRVLPVKGFIPVFIPEPGGGEAFYRLLQRGPVMEVERLDGDGFRCLLQQVEGERFAGHLLRLKLEGRLDLELEAG